MTGNGDTSSAGERILRLLSTLEPILAQLRDQAQLLVERSRPDDKP